MSTPATPEPRAHKFREAARPKMAMIAPNRYAPADIKDGVPEFAIGKFIRAPDGRGYSFIPVQVKLARVNAWLLREIGMGGQIRTLKRLATAEPPFIEMYPVGPHTNMLNMDSWYRHVAECAEHGEEYWNAERRERYRKAL